MSHVRAVVLAFLGVGILALAPVTADAALVTPTSVTSSTDATDFYKVPYLIDNSGLTEPIGLSSLHSTANSTNSWVTAAFAPDYYVAGSIPVLTFELDTTYVLTDAVIWNYALTNANGAKSITVDFSTTGTNGPFSGGVELTLAAGSYATDPAQVLSLGGTFWANAVRFTITDNHYGTIGGGDRVGLSEVKFLGVVPEPSTLLLSLGLLGMCVCALVRRKVRSASAFFA